ncbi:MAG TPA: phenylalanine--tRNA ligase subunit beta [Chromatiales bacterium]|nr:phenylalanine--tRNA ligase subunit beta [Thiotrichales bacterium]HIP69479.1 phenylalanine--tRNA ligase subunit beta [Chromatiales bacterium]
MKFNKSWLDEWIDTGLDAETIGERLTMAGLELDSITAAAPEFSNVVVADIESIAPHPDADKLRVCAVNNGQEVLQVICGAANARAGMRVALAQVGAVLPGGLKIKRAKLRGVESLGMLCSAPELGLAEQSEGIMDLPADAPTGTSLREYLDLDDPIFEVDLTPNRADCLCVAGIAHELGALTGRTVNELEIDEHPPEIIEKIAVTVEADDACPRYIGRLITDINMDAETPLWMSERLRRCGLRSLNPIVDVTNYVMLELGQPMHAFDADKLSGRIVVRMAKKGEKLTLLDEKEITLDTETLVIADEKKPLAMAGIMGGLESAVSNETKSIVLESAFFQPEIISGKARAYGLHTDSSHRFERGVDFELQCKAVARASELIQSIAGGKAGVIVEKVTDNKLPELPVITFRPEQISRILGLEMEQVEAQEILTKLGCLVDATHEDWKVIPPSYRFDLRIEVDLIEELARVHGYDRIKAEQRAWAPVIEKKPEAENSISKIKERMICLEYQEVISYSFIDSLTEQLVNPDYPALPLSNPISTELAVMRTTLWGGLLQTLKHNLRRQQERVRVFETGLVFLQQEKKLTQTQKIAGLISGSSQPEQWMNKTREVDFFDIKGDLEALLNLSQTGQQIEWVTGRHPALHPGQSATLLFEGKTVGHVGALHPQIQKQLDITQEVFLFEIDLSILGKNKLPSYEPLSKFPTVRRDLALLVNEDISYAQIVKSLSSLDNKMITASHIFDVYQGEGVASGLKSIALGLILQDFSRTLEEQDVENVVTQVVEQLNKDVGARLRD